MSEQQHVEWLGVEVVTHNSELEIPEASRLEKAAQRRGFLNWLHEKVNVPRHMAETFSQVYGDVMATLRDVDDRIRQEYAVDLKLQVKEANKALKERRYLDIVHFLSQFNESLKNIVDQGKLLQELRGEQIDDFYGESKFFNLDEDYFGKQAGIMDVFQNIARPMAGNIMERMYRNTLRERYRKLESLINESRAMLNFALTQLKKMASARARGDVSDYLAQLNQIAKRRHVFENTFRQIYNSELKPMIDRMRAEHSKEQEQAEELASGSVLPETAPVPTPTTTEPQAEVEVSLPPEQPTTEPKPLVPESLEFVPESISKEYSEKKAPVAEASADLFIDNLLKDAIKNNLDKRTITQLLLEQSETFDNVGNVFASMKCLAFVKGFLDD